MADMNLLNQILAEILTCSCEILDAGIGDELGSQCGCPCRTFITAGKPVWDLEACCSDGQLAVYVKDIYPIGIFPSRSSEANICSPTLAANITVQLLRCWPATMADDGSSPNSSQIQTASMDIYRDQYLLTWGLVCCLKLNARRRKFVLNGSHVVGPQDGCVGVEVDLIIEIMDI